MKEQSEIMIKGSSEDRTRLEISVPQLPPASYNVEADAEDQINLGNYWRAVRKRLWLVIGVAALATTMTAIYMVRKPDIYQAQARVQVDLESSNPVLGSSKGSSVIVSNPINDPAYFNTQLQILTGPGLLRRVVKTLDLEHNQSFLRPRSAEEGSLWQNLLKLFGLGDKQEESSESKDEVPLINVNKVAPASSKDDLVEAKRLAPFVRALQRGLEVEPVKETRLPIKETRLIDIKFSHPDPQVTAKIVNTMASAFEFSNLEKKTETNSTTGDFLLKRIAELQNRIRNGEERLLNYARSNKIISLEPTQNTVVERLVALNRQLLEAENQRQLAEAAYRAALAPGAAEALISDPSRDLGATSPSADTASRNSAARSSAGDLSQQQQVAGMEAKLAELQMRKQMLLVEFTEEWKDVREVNQQIAELERQIKEARKKAVSHTLASLEIRYRQALAHERAVQAAFEKQRNETLGQNEAAITYRIIQQEIETNKNLLDGLLQRSKEHDVVVAGTVNNIHIVDYATMPDWPIGPQRLRVVGMAFILSLAMGIGLALFLEFMDNTVRSIDDVEKLLHLPALAAIPAIKGSLHRRSLPRENALQLTAGNGSLHPELLINVDARSPLAEVYRQLRTSVLLSTAGGAPKTLLITSCLPSEGKTTTSINLAISLAQTGASVLVIDADMRKPQLHSIFKMENHRGLSTLLTNEVRAADVLDVIRQCEVENLYLLTSGPIPPNPAELVGSRQMRHLIDLLESAFSYIIIDSPPIASVTDAVLISSMVSGLLFVVQPGRSSRELVARSRKMLTDVGAKIFGVVLHKVKLEPREYYYYQYYSAQN
jgi:capsular exopolysaccharide synthesis family protein